MAQQTMYPAINNSVQATLTVALAATDTTIEVTNGDVLPDAPNIATIGIDDDAELVLYMEKTDNVLSSCVRGFNSTTAKIWNVGDLIYRGFTAYDHEAFKNNIDDHEENKLGKTGDGQDVTVTFEQAATRVNIATGEKLSVILGKVKKCFADLKALAFKDTVGTSEIADAAVSNAKMANMAASTIKGNITGSGAPPSDIALLDAMEAGLNLGSTVTEIADAEFVVLSVSSTSSRKITWQNIKTALGNLLAAKDHIHGNITSDGKIGAAAGFVMTDADGDLYSQDDPTTARAALGACAAPFLFTNVAVGTTGWDADTTYEGYGYRKAVALTGVLSGMWADVTFAPADATSGNFSSVAACYDGGIYLYAVAAPDSITIPTIIAWKVA